MAAIVIDASALAALVFDEPDSGDVSARFDDAERVAAPALVWFELANTCWKKIRRHPEQRDWLLERFARARDLPVEVVDVEHRDAIVLACDTGLSVYDASYLLLARHLDVGLLTLDQRLRAVADELRG